MGTKRSQNASAAASKKKKPSSLPSPEEVKQFYQSILTQLFALKDESGELISGPFAKLPPKKVYPDYYQIIESPISLAEIQKKVKQQKYSSSSIDEFLSDFQLLLDNAAKYNDPESWIVSGARKLHDFVNEKSEDFLKQSSEKKESKTSVAKDLSSTPAPASGELKITYDRLPSICINTLKEVMSHEFPNEGIISGPFMEDVDVNEYPDYVNYVAHPTSFNSVIKRIEKKKLFSPKISLADNLERFYNATVLIFNNAQLYNDPSSEIHQDAEKLKQLFEEKHSVLKEELNRLTQLRLKIKQPKVKLNLKLKPDDTKEGGDLKEEAVEEKEEAVKEEIPVVENVAVPSALLEAGPVGVDPEKSTANTLGKSLPTIDEDDTVIQEVSLASSAAAVSHITKHTQQKAQQTRNLPLPKHEEMKQALFPSHSIQPVTTFFEFKVPSNGYAIQSYTTALPPDVSAYVNFKVSLHSLLYNVKRPYLVDGRGLHTSATDESFQCKLTANDREVTKGGDYFEQKSGEETRLGISYDLKLCQGLNVLEFEVKVAPALGKEFKHTKPPEDGEETAGRHTRHQLQQMKMTWEVERFTFYVVCNTT